MKTNNIIVKEISLKDLARMAQVSATTVSRALRDKPDIGRKKKEEIQRLAEKFNYRPHEAARNLKLGKTFSIGLSIPACLDNPLYGELAQEIQKETKKRGYSLLLSVSSAYMKRSISLLQRKTVDGIIMGPAFSINSIPTFWEMQRNNAPFVIFGNFDMIETDSVTIDREKAVYQAIKHLVELGHRDFAYLCVNKNDLFVQTKLRGFQKALMENGLPLREEYLLEADATIPSSYKKTMELLELNPRPTAVFCHNDLTAMTFIRAVNEKGFKVPDDFSVIGFDNIELSQYSIPALTTINQPRRETAEHLVRILIEKLENPDKEKEQVILPAELIIRESTAPVRKGERRKTKTAVAGKRSFINKGGTKQ